MPKLLAACAVLVGACALAACGESGGSDGTAQRAEWTRLESSALARTEVAAARDAFVDLDARRDADAAARLLDRRDSGPLTRREREILAFVAAGKSNREIASELVISQHTVHRHVANILRKLGEPTRAAAAARAERDRLV